MNLSDKNDMYASMEKKILYKNNVIFHKNLASETKCPKCKEGRYKPGLKSNSSPRKVIHHFILIPWLL